MHSRRNNKASLLTLFSIIVIDLIGFGIVIPVLPFYAEFYGASATVLGMLLTSYAAMQFLFAPLWGRLSDRIGRRPVLLMTILGSSFALVMLGMANSLFWLFMARILGGTFGANISVATAYVTDVTTEENRTRWMGMIGASFGIGYGVPMLFASALAFINFIYACIILREPERHRTTEKPVARMRLFQNHVVRRMCAINLLFTLAVTQLEAIFAFYMMDRFEYDAREVAYILVMMALIMVGIQGGAIRRLAKRFGEKNLLLIGVMLMAIAYLGIPWIPQVALLLIPLAITAAGRGMAQPSMLSLISSASDADNRGSVLGIFQSSASLARVIGPTVAGILYDRFFGIPFMCAATVMLAVFIVATGLTVKAPHKVTLEEAEMAME
jgi:DHA1 family tetracycline resistance protein-like MFS transporter